MKKIFVLYFSSLILASCASLETEPVKIASLTALVETRAVDSVDDAADDPAIWVHPTEPEHSLVLGTNKQTGLEIYDLQGKRLQSLAVGRLNNVDLRQGVDPPAQTVRRMGTAAIPAGDGGSRPSQ